MSKLKIAIIFLTFLCVFTSVNKLAAQSRMGMTTRSGTEQKYEIADFTIVGAKYLDEGILKTVSGISAGDKILLKNDPNITRAIRKLWDQKYLEDIRFEIVKIQDDRVWLELIIKERPRISGIEFKGITHGQETELKEKIGLKYNRMLTEAYKVDMKEKVRAYYAAKGFMNVSTEITERKDPKLNNTVILTLNINRGQKVKINQVTIKGNEEIADAKIKRTMKSTKEMPRLSLAPASETTIDGVEQRSFKKYLKDKGFLSLSKTLDALDPYFRYNVFGSSKFNPKKFESDKEAIIAYYNTLGYRDAKIVGDTLYYIESGHLNIDVQVSEGKRYYFGDINFKGNTIYPDSLLSKIIAVKKGDVYNRALLDSKLGAVPSMDGEGDIGSLYLDDGHLFFTITAQERAIINDTIDFDVVIREGPKAPIKNVDILGNMRTNDHVLRRELFTKPGDNFSRADLIRSIRQVSQLGFVDPEKVNPNFKPNPVDYTVDIDYNITEKSADQLELSMGYGGGIGVQGSLGLVFNNFSLRNLFKPKNWDPMPIGDGQKLSIRYQSNGLWFNSANFSFTEPWLGGKKPNALTVSGVYSRMARGSYFVSGSSPNQSYLVNIGGGVSMGKRLSWPDDYFVFSYGINYQNYFLKEFELFQGVEFRNGSSNNLFARLTLSRSSVDQPIFPRKGSNLNFTFQFTPPYSMFSEKDFADAPAKEKYKWIEYHKYRFNAEWYQQIAGNLVLKLAAKYGFMGYYNKDIGFSPFERFQMGGDGLSGFNFFVGRDIIAHRGYEIYNESATIFNKYTAEVRYPFSLNPSATIFGLAFVEGGYAWNNIKEYNPFQLNRSVGLGVRIYLPMFGLLGLDYGIGIDRHEPGMRFNQITKFTFMLGMEPD